MALKGTVWTPIGPSPISEVGNQDNGLVSSIAIHPFNSNVIYIGTAGGGVWRSRDGGTTWRPLFDRQLVLGIGEPAAIAIDPSNTDIVYAGSSQRIVLGTGNSGFFGQPDSSQGLFKSTDQGETWIQLGSGFPPGNNGNATNLVGQNINVVIVDPANSNNLYLASSSGVFFSNDAGENWTQGNNAVGDARSLVLDTTSPAGARILYAGISGQGVFSSADGGQNWNQILSGATPAVSTAVGAFPKGFNKVIVAIAPPSSPPNAAGIQVLYVTLEGTGGANDPVGVFISTNQGGTWAQQAATGMPTGTQGGYSFHMAVDPASPGDGVNDIIYFGTVGQAKSTNSGVSFSGLGVPHADTHAWAFFPRPSLASVVYCGNDGGLDVSFNGGGAWTALGAGGLQTGLFYNVDIRPDATGSVIVGALQDNGLMTTAGVASPTWNSPQSGDGFDIAYDGVTLGRLYGTSGFWPAPCTRVFSSTVDGTDLPQFVPSGQDISPYGTTSDQNCGIFPITTDPSNAGFVYVSGNQNLWQTQNGGTSWRKIGSFGGTGDIDVAAANGNNVVIAVGSQVFLSTNALAATVTFTNITRNLPSRNVPRVRFDPVDPTVLYAVLGGFNGFGAGQQGHVFRTTIGGTAWTDISPVVGSLGEQLDLPFNAIALDGTDIPTTIYVGTDLGVLRSMDTGLSWTILDDLHFPRVPVTDLVMNQQAGLLCAGTYGRGAFKFALPTGPVISLSLQDDLNFGVVCSGPQFLTLEITNVGVSDLIINSVQRIFGSNDFTVLANPATPLVLAAGEEIDFTIEYLPSVPGVFETAIIQISSNDPTAPLVDVATTGMQGTGALAAVIANTGDFGNVCVGSHSDELLTLNNVGSCPLSIFNISCAPADFEPPSNAFFPLVINPGASLDVEIRFKPLSFGFKSGTVTIVSDDPASPAMVFVSGTAPAPRLCLVIADNGDFGKCCVGSFVDQPLVLTNSGKCTLTVTSISSSSGEFLAPEVLSFPITIGPGDAVAVPIRFEPTSFGAKAATITVTSDDPLSPATISVTGRAPSGRLTITGSTIFGGVKCCHREQRTISICNTGDCNLHVRHVSLKKRRRHYRLINNPFPNTLRPGSCLNVVIQYKANERVSRGCELEIHCDDPEHPFRCIEVFAYTIWECCCDCCCGEDHRKGCCKEPCAKCCEDHDDDEDDHDEHERHHREYDEEGEHKKEHRVGDEEDEM